MSLNENFNRSYKRASGRLRLLQSVRRNLTAASAIDIYNMMILPILTYSSTIKTIFTDSQLAKFTSFERRACKVIGTKSIPNTKKLVQSQICFMVEKCLQKNFEHDTLDNYFQMVSHEKETKNKSISIKLPRIKLELAKQSFYFGGAKLFNDYQQQHEDL
jgi:hypothetical protein